MKVETLRWHDGTLYLLDQTRLPHVVAEVECRDYRAVASAIREMRVRGAPAIGVAAAFGMALGALRGSARTAAELAAEMDPVARELRATRPTAVNLFWAIERMLRTVQSAGDAQSGRAALVAEAQRIAAEDVAMCKRIGRFGAALVPDGARILTHCNAGALATAGYGTALGVIRAAHEQGKRVHVYVDETRPLLQGARLTAWELSHEGIPLTLITDSMAGHFMRRGAIDLVVVGADRIAANGDVANKIGTYGVAVLARAHGLPFYVAAPKSTVDHSMATGDQIPIEERSADEVLGFAGQRVAPEGVRAANPAFDVTPYRYITSIVTDAGVIRAPYDTGLAELRAERGPAV